MKQHMTFNLLTVTGKVKTAGIEETRRLHNDTAGNAEGVAAAKSLGDMSHMVYMPTDAGATFKGDLLFMDIWNSMEGLQKFFSDPQVQAGADLMFESREAIVWNRLDGYMSCHFPAPTGRNGRVVGLVRGMVKSIEEAKAIHNAAMEKRVAASRACGLLSHEFYVRDAAPGSPEALEVLGVDVWMDAAGMMAHYTSAGFRDSGVHAMFSARPASSTWSHPGGEWIEW